MSSVTKPIKLLHEGIGHTVTIELMDGSSYRGHMMNVEDNMNAILDGVTYTDVYSRVSMLQQVYDVAMPHIRTSGRFP